MYKFQAGDKQPVQPDQVTTGRGYVNALGILRVVTAEVRDEVLYDTFDLMSSGEFTESRQDTILEFCGWAWREATLEEMELVTPPNERYAAEAAVARQILANVPTNLLERELSARKK